MQTLWQETLRHAGSDALMVGIAAVPERVRSCIDTAARIWRDLDAPGCQGPACATQRLDPAWGSLYRVGGCSAILIVVPYLVATRSSGSNRLPDAPRRTVPGNRH